MHEALEAMVFGSLSTNATHDEGAMKAFRVKVKAKCVPRAGQTYFYRAGQAWPCGAVEEKELVVVPQKELDQLDYGQKKRLLRGNTISEQQLESLFHDPFVTPLSEAPEILDEVVLTIPSSEKEAVKITVLTKAVTKGKGR